MLHIKRSLAYDQYYLNYLLSCKLLVILNMILYRYIQFAERFSNADVALLTTNLSMMVNTEQLILRMKKIN